MKNRLVLLVCLFVIISGFCCVVMARGAGAVMELKPYIQTVEQAQKGMTLWQLIKAGGSLMFVLAFLSIAVLANIVYNFMTLKVSKLSPRDFAEDITEKLEKGKYKVVEELCRSQENIISKIVLSGLEKREQGIVTAKEAMEHSGRKEITALWQNINFLTDIGTIAPLVGLLGTILGLIQAFNVIAFQLAVVKPMLLAGGVAKAMVTTAAGLIVAIPALFFQSVFRNRLQEISHVVETYTTYIEKLIEKV